MDYWTIWGVISLAFLVVGWRIGTQLKRIADKE